ncbi:Serine/threonine-protein phosphatase 7 long form-like [Vitis vinifera]|uniref:Serine/threonine-protein phosphatase 7 long form-like n=1 Tax=Vitis vinifera TaxID=29760 RepID=A0A438DFT6_VITVI|nr:Serine/threonine-protein phosphatase 7 long form-like [Vitis vinifera]
MIYGIIGVDRDDQLVLKCRHPTEMNKFQPLVLWSWERLHVGRPSRSLPHAPVPIDERFPPDALGSRWRVPLSHTDTPHHVLVTYRDEFDRQRSDQVLWQPYTDDILALLPDICLADQDIWRTMSPLIFFDIVEWHRPERVLRQFGLIQGIPSTPPIDSDLHSIDRRGRPQFDWRGHALEDSDTDACRTGIVDIIRMATDVMCIIREDYRLPYVEHGGDRSPAQSTVARPPLVRGRSTSRGRGRYSSCHPITSSVSASLQPPTFLSSRLVQSPISLDVPSVQHPTSSDPPSAQPLTSSDPPSVQPPTSLDLPPSQPPTSSDPPLV